MALTEEQLEKFQAMQGDLDDIKAEVSTAQENVLNAESVESLEDFIASLESARDASKTAIDLLNTHLKEARELLKADEEQDEDDA